MDPLVHDVHTLTTINEVVAEAEPAEGEARRPAAEPCQAGARQASHKRVPYMLIAPEDPERDRRARRRASTRSTTRASAAQRARATSRCSATRSTRDSTPVRGELFSYLFFAPEFARALLELGRADAKRWLSRRHDNGPWRLRPLPS